MKRILSRADIILFVIIVAAAVVGIVLMAGRGSGGTAVIRVNGEAYKEVDLGADQQIIIGEVHIEVYDGKIAFVESDCETHACIKTGWLSLPGQSAACLPNRISITVTGESGVDAVAE
jgi:hypothetical protein